MHRSVHPLLLRHIRTGEDTDVEHAIAIITTVGDGDVFVIDRTIMGGIKTHPTILVVDFNPGVRGPFAAEQTGDIT